MNTMMLALLQDRLWNAASLLQRQLQAGDVVHDEAVDDTVASELSQVLQALDALDAGRYGLCGDCDRPLELDQLLLKPHRLLCSDCEGARQASRRLFTSLAGLRATH